jgi:hypothetical protein
MKILLAYFSRTGNTERLALHLAEALRCRGHQVAVEKIQAEQTPGKWRLALPLLSTLPVLPLYLWLPSFRRWWHARYRQAEQSIHPLAYPDVSQFDAICIGGPKWLYISYPVARYLQQIQGIAGKRIGAFATFCGPPLPVFEMEMLFAPLQMRLQQRGASLDATLAISSQFHEFFFFREMEYVFRLVSRLRFKQSLHAFALESCWGNKQVQQFCDALHAQPATLTTDWLES